MVATGLMVAKALEAVKYLEADGIHAGVIDIHTIKPLDSEIILKAAGKTGKIVVLEEHSVIGGLGSAVSELLSELFPIPVKRIGINDVYGRSGPAEELLHYYGLDAEGIYRQVKGFL